MRPNLAFGSKIKPPTTTFVRLAVAIPVGDAVRRPVIKVTETRRFDQDSVFAFWRVAAVDFPGWVTIVGVADALEEGWGWVTVVIAVLPDRAQGFAVVDLEGCIGVEGFGGIGFHFWEVVSLGDGMVSW